MPAPVTAGATQAAGDRPRRDAGARRPSNHVWPVTLPDGATLMLKHYAERGGPVAWRLRAAGTALLGRKTGSSARARRATEAAALAAWRAAGCDVPAELSATCPDLAGPDRLPLEDCRGPLLADLLADPALPETRRAELLSRWGGDIARRHRAALRLQRADLIHEHGGAQHVLVMAGPPERLVSFDHEVCFLPRSDVRPLLVHESGAILRSLARSAYARVRRSGAAAADLPLAGEAALCADLLHFLRGHGDPDTLRAACDLALHPRTPLARLVRRVDRRRAERRATATRPSKFRVFEILDGLLGSVPRPSAAPAARDPTALSSSPAA